MDAGNPLTELAVALQSLEPDPLQAASWTHTGTIAFHDQTAHHAGAPSFDVTVLPWHHHLPPQNLQQHGTSTWMRFALKAQLHWPSSLLPQCLNHSSSSWTAGNMVGLLNSQISQQAVQFLRMRSEMALHRALRMVPASQNQAEDLGAAAWILEDAASV